MTAPHSYRLTDIKLPLDHAPDALQVAVALLLDVLTEDVKSLVVFKRGYDARKKSDIHFIYTVDVCLQEGVPREKIKQLKSSPDMAYQFVTHAKERAGHSALRPVVVGTGPCGLFAALVLAQMGFRPVVLERGRAVRERTQDTWDFWRKRELNVQSNVQFGEGGAGTFSDGKLWTQVKDPRYLGRKVLQEMVKGGAPEEILHVSKPHVGTFRLVKVVEYLRAEIIQLGGEFRFQAKVVDLQIEMDKKGERQLQGVCLENGETIATNHVVLAIGHSARDTFEMLHQRGVFMQAKAFSVGFRIEHPQGLIDRARFGKFAGHAMLGAADYKLVHHAKNGRSVYSFCMCPGGTVVAATSEAKRVVTNGMSQYSRNERNANAGIVVGIEPQDFLLGLNGQALKLENDAGEPLPPVLAGVCFQRAWESQAYVLGGETYAAPAQLVGDFLLGRASTQMGEVLPSYQPSVHLTDLTGGGGGRDSGKGSALPLYAIEAIQEALPAWGKQIAGFDRADALLSGVETRTSSPIRITRHDERAVHPLQSVNTVGLYPAGEGAGYAGGIMSAAIDGLKVAECVALALAIPK